MSVNALTTLFEEIAQAIKDKTGDTATMKPAEFPEKITGIQTGAETEETSVALDLADGDQIVTPSADGKVLSQVTIQKPDTLVPQNIAEGVDIAGIIGTLVVDSGAKIASGTFNGNDGAVSVTHDLGVIPDIVYIQGRWNATVTGINAIMFGVGLSSNFKAVSGLLRACTLMSREWSASSSYQDTLYATDTAYLDSANSPIRATDETITLGTTPYVASSGYTYYWLAIGGLT